LYVVEVAVVVVEEEEEEEERVHIQRSKTVGSSLFDS
jgi:hypothetical protein